MKKLIVAALLVAGSVAAYAGVSCCLEKAACCPGPCCEAAK